MQLSFTMLLCKLGHVQIWGKCGNRNNSYDLNVIKNVTRYTGIHTFHITDINLLVAHVEIYLFNSSRLPVEPCIYVLPIVYVPLLIPLSLSQ